jgi:hypothetical protein
MSPAERHRLDAEFLAEPAHRQGIDAISVCEVDGGTEDALASQG